MKSGSLRGGNFSGRAAFAYRVEKSSGPETYQNVLKEEFPNGAVIELTTVRD